MPEVLNKALYDALCSDGAEVHVKHEGQPAGYSYPDKADGNLTYSQKRGEIFVKLDPYQWGEIYNRSCPVCGDHGKHLFISHVLGGKVKDGDGKPVRFSKFSGYVCHRRHCNLTNWIKSLNLPDDIWLEPSKIRCIGTGDITFASMRKEGHATLPQPNYCITASQTPEAVRAYLRSRNMDPDYLADRWKVRYAPLRSVYEYIDKDGNKQTAAMKESRLIFPIMMHRRLQSWQSRRVFKALDGNDKKFKYMFPYDTPKAAYLYNFDNALMYADVAITEGVMKVIHLGDHTLATFGKSLSEIQAELLKIVFSYDGRCCIVYDPDAYEHGDDVRAAKLLLEKQSFKRGVSILRLKGDLQPEDRDKDEVNAMIEAAWEKAVLVPEDVLKGIYNEPEAAELQSLTEAYRERLAEKLSQPTQVELDLQADEQADTYTQMEEEYNDY